MRTIGLHSGPSAPCMSRLANQLDQAARWTGWPRRLAAWLAGEKLAEKFWLVQLAGGSELYRQLPSVFRMDRRIRLGIAQTLHYSKNDFSVLRMDQ